MLLFTDPTVGIGDPMLRRAYALAERGRGTVSPNPLVGCVVVRDGVIVGEGYHERAGGPHAEAAALQNAGERARGAHVYVTLEPCNHFGRTPPCVGRLLAAGVSAVTIGMADPNPNVTGSGAQALAEAGVQVVWADDPSPFQVQNEAWLTRMRTGRPFVTVKVALTIDGRPALASGLRSRITGAGGSGVTMRLRSAATAVAVGAATVAIDDPLLTVRDRAGNVAAGHAPRRVVLGRTTLPPPDAAIFSDGAEGTIVVVSDGAPAEAVAVMERRGVTILRYPFEEGLKGALRVLASEGVDDVLVEAGPTLFSALWHDGLIHQLVVVSAGGVGGATAPPLYLGGPDAHEGNLAPPLEAVESAVVDGDAVVVWRPRRAAAGGSGQGSVG